MVAQPLRLADDERDAGAPVHAEEVLDDLPRTLPGVQWERSTWLASHSTMPTRR
jgi:hypothetical protein